MSKFFGAYSDDDDDDNEEVAAPISRVAEAQSQARNTGRFVVDDSDNDSDEKVRVVRSQQDRAWDAIREGIRKLHNSQKNSDWPQIVDEFEAVNKLVEKSRMVIITYGLPKFYIRMLAEIEDHVKNSLNDKKATKKMKPVVLRSLQQMKLKVKRHNDKFRAEIADFRENPDKYETVESSDQSQKKRVDNDDDDDDDDDNDDDDDDDDDDNDDDDDEADDDEEVQAKIKPVKKVPPKKDDDWSDDDEDSYVEEKSDASSMSDAPQDGQPVLKGRDKWLKKDYVKGGGEEKSKFKEEARVEANFKGRGKWYTGKIKRDRLDGTYDIAYVGGVKENKVKEINIRRPLSQRDIVLLSNATASSGIQGSSATALQSDWLLEDNMTEEVLDKKVNDLISSRGRKNTQVKDILKQLEILTKAARLHGPRKEIPVVMHLISMMFDSQRSIDDYMDHQQWRTCYRSLTRITTLLESKKNLILTRYQGEEMTDILLGAPNAKNKREDGEFEDKVPLVEAVPEDKNSIKVVGSLESFVIRLEDEYTKSLQQINPHTQEYINRLGDEAALIDLADAVVAYYNRCGDSVAAANVSLLIVEHMYYKHESVATAVHRAHVFNNMWGKFNDVHPACIGKMAAANLSTPSININLPKKSKKAVDDTDIVELIVKRQAMIHPGSLLGNPTVNTPIINFAKKIDDLASFIYKNGDERIRTRTLLCTVFHHALHDRYYQARDLFLISHVQDFIDKADVKTQILYNRALAMLGLCSFRLGLFQKAHDSLSGICGGKVKELLAQGTVKSLDKDIEQEKVERRRQTPYHMHINPDLLECCHLTCAMLLELPILAKSSLNSTIAQNFVSKIFRKHLLLYNKQVFTGPPENIREHIMASTSAILKGEWQKAADYILGLEVWNLIPNDGGDKVKELLGKKIREESIQVFLLMNGDLYDSLRLSQLCQMFSINETDTRRIICRMIFNREISAAWDSSDILLMYKLDPNPIQTLSKNVVEKISTLLESNERLLDPLVGSAYGYRDLDNTVSGSANTQQGGRRNWNTSTEVQQSGVRRKIKSLGWNSAQHPYPGKQSGRLSGRGGSYRLSGGQGRGTNWGSVNNRMAGRGRGGAGGGGGSGGGGVTETIQISSTQQSSRRWANSSSSQI